MHKLNRSNRDKLQQFIAITGANEKAALQSLKASDWHLEGAFDLFYSQSHFKAYTDSRHLEDLYKRYKDPHADMIMADGITNLCSDLQVDPQDIVMLVISWHMKAATMCEFSKQEFIGGLQSLGIDTLDKFRERVQYMRSELKDENKFREIYNFAFGWALEKRKRKSPQSKGTLYDAEDAVGKSTRKKLKLIRPQPDVATKGTTTTSTNDSDFEDSDNRQPVERYSKKQEPSRAKFEFVKLFGRPFS